MWVITYRSLTSPLPHPLLSWRDSPTLKTKTPTSSMTQSRKCTWVSVQIYKYWKSISISFSGKHPSNIKRCSRCTAVTQVQHHEQTQLYAEMNKYSPFRIISQKYIPQAAPAPKTTFGQLWQGRWSSNCVCGGPWTNVKLS